MTHPSPAIRLLLAAVLGGCLAACAGTSTTTVPAAGGAFSAIRRPHAVPAVLASEGFSPSAVQAGGLSFLSITLTNPSSIEVNQLHFTDTLPSGIYVAGAIYGATSNSCTGTTSATPGGQTFGFANVKLVPDSSCTMTFEVSGFLQGTYTNEIPAGSMVAPLTNTSPPYNVFSTPSLKIGAANHHP